VSATSRHSARPAGVGTCIPTPYEAQPASGPGRGLTPPRRAARAAPRTARR
jgi:hypothetical protein